MSIPCTTMNSAISRQTSFVQTFVALANLRRSGCLLLAFLQCSGLRAPFLPVIRFLIACVVMREAVAQESVNPAANPLDPAALNAPPAFGDSGPVKRRVVAGAQSSFDANDVAEVSEWKPKFRVLLTIQPADMDSPRHSWSIDNEVDDTTVTPPVASVTEQQSDPLPPQQIILLCDDVTVQAVVDNDTRDGKGVAACRLTCRRRMALLMAGTTIHGDSLNSDADTITVDNAVVSLSNRVTLQSETMALLLHVTGVNVQTLSASSGSGFGEKIPLEEQLRPIPDTIGRGSDEQSVRPDAVAEQPDPG